MQDINFKEYLSELEMKDIAEKAFYDHCKSQYLSTSSGATPNHERIISNAAYHCVTEIVNEHFGENLMTLLEEKVIKIIEGLTEHTVFRKPDAWDTKGSSVGHEVIKETILNNKELIETKVKELVEPCVVEQLTKEVKEEVVEMAQNLLADRLFGGNY